MGLILFVCNGIECVNLGDRFIVNTMLFNEDCFYDCINNSSNRIIIADVSKMVSGYNKIYCLQHIDSVPRAMSMRANNGPSVSDMVLISNFLVNVKNYNKGVNEH